MTQSGDKAALVAVGVSTRQSERGDRGSPEPAGEGASSDRRGGLCTPDLTATCEMPLTSTFLSQLRREERDGMRASPLALHIQRVVDTSCLIFAKGMSKPPATARLLGAREG